MAARDIANMADPIWYDGDHGMNEDHYHNDDDPDYGFRGFAQNDNESGDEEYNDSDEEEEYFRRTTETSTSQSLHSSLTRFIHHPSVRDSVLDESPTLRLEKALHETKLEHVILAIEQGARINFEVCNDSQYR